MNYKDSGVDIEKANQFISNNKDVIQKTYNNNILNNKNNFAGLYNLSKFRYYQNPVLAVSCDGIGSKIKLAVKYNLPDTYYSLGWDVVSNNVNDILCSGATPLMFLDYYATGKLDLDKADNIIKGIVDNCINCNMTLIGGETAELPLTYREDDFDLVGTCIGITEKDKIFLPEQIRIGDALIGIRSSGPHSNGYSLINKLVDKNTPDNIINDMLQPIRNYFKYWNSLNLHTNLLGCANITGGGFTDNIPRILPDNVAAYINLDSYQRPEVFNWIQKTGNVSEEEMLRVFNLGIGMVICVPEEDIPVAQDILGNDGIVLGNVIKKTRESQIVYKYK